MKEKYLDDTEQKAIIDRVTSELEEVSESEKKDIAGNILLGCMGNELNIDEKTTLKLLEICIKVGADVNKRNYNAERGITTLHFAVQKGYVRCVEALLKAGANPNLKDYGTYGETALMYLLRAVDRSKELTEKARDIIKLLIAHGAEVGEETTQFAKQKGMVDLISDKSKDYTRGAAGGLFKQKGLPVELGKHIGSFIGSPIDGRNMGLANKQTHEAGKKEVEEQEKKKPR